MHYGEDLDTASAENGQTSTADHVTSDVAFTGSDESFPDPPPECMEVTAEAGTSGENDDDDVRGDVMQSSENSAGDMTNGGVQYPDVETNTAVDQASHATGSNGNYDTGFDASPSPVTELHEGDQTGHWDDSGSGRYTEEIVSSAHGGDQTAADNSDEIQTSFGVDDMTGRQAAEDDVEIQNDNAPGAPDVPLSVDQDESGKAGPSEAGSDPSLADSVAIDVNNEDTTSRETPQTNGYASDIQEVNGSVSDAQQAAEYASNTAEATDVESNNQQANGYASDTQQTTGYATNTPETNGYVSDAQQTNGYASDTPETTGYITDETDDQAWYNSKPAVSWQISGYESQTSESEVQKADVVIAGYDKIEPTPSTSSKDSQAKKDIPITESPKPAKSNKVYIDPEDPRYWFKPRTIINMDCYFAFACISCFFNVFCGMLALYYVQKGRDATTRSGAERYGCYSAAAAGLGILITAAAIALLIIYT